MAAESVHVDSPRTIAAPRRHFSVWAILSLLLSVTVFCPVFSVLGALFALRALAEIKVQPNLRGRGVAIAAMTIAILATIGWIVGGILWHQHARTPMLTGPVVELRAGMSGDVASYKAGFAVEGATATDHEARQFLDELSRRFGTLVGSEQDSATKGSMPAGGQGRIPYVLHFRNGDIRAEALFVAFGGSPFRPVFAWDWVRIIDPERDDLVYPLSASERAAPQAAATQP